MSWQDDVRRAAHGVRLRVLEHVLLHDGGYLSQACSSAELLSTLYLRIMRLGPSDAPRDPPPFGGVPGPGRRGCFSGSLYNGPRSPVLDRFFFSPAHYALVLYAVLVEAGRMDGSALEHFNRDGSTVEMIAAEHSPGIEVMCGSLAQTISQAAGVALARKRRGDSGRVWVFLSDGELQEGQTWEAIQAMAGFRLDNMGVCVDVNGQQCDGMTKDVMAIEPLDDKLRAFGMNVVVVADGHDVDALARAAERAGEAGPLFMLAYTDPCRGVEVLRKRAPRLHYLRFADASEKREYQGALDAMKGKT